MFTRKDLHVLMLALNISNTILQKNSDVFVGPFVKEGVLFAIDSLIVPEKNSQFMFSMFNDIQLSNNSSQKQCLCYSFDTRRSSESRKCKLEKDCVQPLAKHIRADFFDTNSSTSANGTTPILDNLKSLSSELNSMMNNCMVEEEYNRVLHQIMSHLNGTDVISTFEFVESGITESLFNYLSNGECSRRFETFGRLFTSKFSLSEFILKLQSALSSVEDFPIVLNNASKMRNSYATVPCKHATTYSCLRVMFEKGEGELTLRDYSGDVQTVDPFSDFDGIEKFLWAKVCSNDNKDKSSDMEVCEKGSSSQSVSSSFLFDLLIRFIVPN